MIRKIIENEIANFKNNSVEISPGVQFSQWNLTERILLYANQIYTYGKTDSQGNYKYWFDITSPRIDTEVKNIDFDTSDVIAFSEPKKDVTAVFLTNGRLKEWMRENGQATVINDSIEEYSDWGNVVWKKVKDGYEKVDLKNFFVINQAARTLNDTPAIERHSLSQSQLRAKKNVWNSDAIDTLIDKNTNRDLSTTEEGNPEPKETPYYEIYERNGEVSLEDLKEAQGKKADDGDEKIFVLAKIVMPEVGDDFLYAKEISEMPYREAHRGRYNGRWWRVGIREKLFEIQTRANEIGNHIARGLEWASKTVFSSADRVIAKNILTDMQSGDVIKSTDLKQVDVRMHGLDQLIADWNRLMALADQLCNSYEVTRGETMPSGTPFRLGAMLSIAAGKMFDFLREKLALGLKDVFQDWILPDLINEMKGQDILRITGNADYIKRFYEIAVEGWYRRNLWNIGTHTPEQAAILKEMKVAEWQKSEGDFTKMTKRIFADFKPRAQIIITGENVKLASDLETLATFANMEADPIRRTALIEMAMAKKGLDVSMLPKSTPEQLQPVSPAATGRPTETAALEKEVLGGGEKTI